MTSEPSTPVTSASLFAEREAAWLVAIPARHSRRRFDERPCDASALDALDAVCAGFRPYPDARVVLVREPGSDVFRGIIGSYGKVTGAPHVLVIIADTTTGEAQQHAGYVGEAAILEAAALGLDTCWVGGFFSPRRVARLVDLTAGERVLAVSPVGYATAEADAGERALKRMARSHERKPLATIAPDIAAESPAWVRSALDAARLAPSAMNRQPWRFRLEDDSLVVARDSAAETPKVTKALDCGIAMLHAELAARAAGAPGQWQDLKAGLDVARYVPTAAR